MGQTSPERSFVYQQENREHISRNRKEYYEKNKEKIRAYHREWEKKNGANKNKMDVSVYREMLLGVLAVRDSDTCGLCGKFVEEKDRSVDHKEQRYMGGDHSPSNIRLAHWECNKRRPRRETFANNDPRITNMTLEDLLDGNV